MTARMFLVTIATVAITITSVTATERDAMLEITQTLSVLLPLSADGQDFRNPANRTTIDQSLLALTENTATLSKHTAAWEAGSNYLGRSLAARTRETLRDFSAKRFDRARAQLQRITTYCIACHSKLPHADSQLGKRLIAGIQMHELPLEKQAAIQVATRQFSAAMNTYENIISNQSVHPGDIASGPLTDYLIIAIRASQDYARPIPILEAFSARADLWPALREDVQRWLPLLKTESKRAPQPASLERARTLIATARGQHRFMMDRRVLIHYIVASSILNRFVNEQHTLQADNSALAEAYYLLGLAEYRIDRDYWLLQGDHYLETAIRMNPSAVVARRAFALLEEQTIVGFSGSSGTHIPDDVQAHLDDLRSVINGASASTRP